MPGKSKLKWIKSLQLKKYRIAEQCFTVQGWKGVSELLHSGAFEVPLVLATEEFVPRVTSLSGAGTAIEAVTIRDLESLGSFQTNDSVLAVARMREAGRPEAGRYPILMLDDIRDPGNMGTILRTADWFGIRHVVVSETSVDFYNPKVINASMGSFCRMQVHPTDLVSWLSDVRVPVLGTFLDGAPLQETPIHPAAVLVIGNESNGISPGVAERVTRRVTIPGTDGAESLNAAVAAGIVMYAWMTGAGRTA